MPAQMPPAASSAGEAPSNTIMSTPGPMPSGSTPRIVTVNGSGVTPRLTVNPVPVMPTVISSTGTGVGKPAAMPSDRDAAAALAVSDPVSSPPATNAAPASTGLRPYFRMLSIVVASS